MTEMISGLTAAELATVVDRIERWEEALQAEYDADWWVILREQYDDERWAPVEASVTTTLGEVAFHVATVTRIHPAVIEEPCWSPEAEWAGVVEGILEDCLAAAPRQFDYGLGEDFDSVRAEIIELAKKHDDFDAAAVEVALRHARPVALTTMSTAST